MSNIGREGELIIEALARNDSRLTRVDFKDLTTEQVNRALKLLKESISAGNLKVTQIDLNSTLHMTREQILELAEILSNPASPVDSLFIEGQISFECLNAFSNMLAKNPKFKTLSFANIDLFSGKNLNKEIVAAIDLLYMGIVACKGLENLNLERNPILGNYETYIVDVFESPSLLSVIESLPHLRDLNLTQTFLNDQIIIDIINELIKIGKLKRLSISQPHIISNKLASFIALLFEKLSIEEFDWFDKDSAIDQENTTSIILSGALKSRSLHTLKLGSLIKTREDFKSLLLLLLNNRVLVNLKLKGISIEHFDEKQKKSLFANLTKNLILKNLDISGHAWTVTEACDFIASAQNLIGLSINVGRRDPVNDLKILGNILHSNMVLQGLDVVFGEIYGIREIRTVMRYIDLVNKRGHDGDHENELSRLFAPNPFLSSFVPEAIPISPTNTSSSPPVLEELTFEKAFILEYWKEYIAFMSENEEHPIVVTDEQKALANPVIERTLLKFLKDMHIKAEDQHKLNAMLNRLKTGQVRTLLCITHNESSLRILAQQSQVFNNELRIVYADLFPITPVEMKSGFEHQSKKPRFF